MLVTLVLGALRDRIDGIGGTMNEGIDRATGIARRRGELVVLPNAAIAQPQTLAETHDSARDAYEHARAAFAHLEACHHQGRFGKSEKATFHAHLHAFHQLHRQAHRKRARTMAPPRRAMHEAFIDAHEAYWSAQVAIERARRARATARVDGPEQTELHARVREYLALSRAAHDLAIEVVDARVAPRISRAAISTAPA